MGGIQLEPLKQWVCDYCGEIIEKPKDGYVIWRENNDNKIVEMRIVHRNVRENDKATGCDKTSGVFSFWYRSKFFCW